MNTLPTWLDDVRRRGCHITIVDHVIQVRGPAARDNDRHHVNRHRHTLETAAAGTHPDWWTYVTGRDRTRWPDPDQLPWTCSTCGTPDCAVLDADLIAWCDQHAPEVLP